MNTCEIEPFSLSDSSYSRPSRLWLTAYDRNSRRVASETHPEYCAQGGWIELIDEQSARLDLGVVRIDIELRDSDGMVCTAWSMCYDEAGVLAEAYETTDSARNAALMAEQFARRLRWLVGPGTESVRAKSATMSV